MKNKEQYEEKFKGWLFKEESMNLVCKQYTHDLLLQVYIEPL